MKNLGYFLLVLFVCACSSEMETTISELSKDDANRYLVEYLSIADNGLYQLGISENEASKNGVSKADYREAVSQMESVNRLILEGQQNGDSILYATSDSLVMSFPRTRTVSLYNATVDGPTNAIFETSSNTTITIEAGSTQFVWGLYVDNKLLSGNLYQRNSMILVGGPSWNLSLRKAVDSAAPIFVSIYASGVMYQGLYYQEGDVFEVVINGEKKKAIVKNGQIMVMP